MGYIRLSAISHLIIKEIRRSLLRIYFVHFLPQIIKSELYHRAQGSVWFDPSTPLAFCLIVKHNFVFHLQCVFLLWWFSSRCLFLGTACFLSIRSCQQLILAHLSHLSVTSATHLTVLLGPLALSLCIHGVSVRMQVLGAADRPSKGAWS